MKDKELGKSPEILAKEATIKALQADLRKRTGVLKSLKTRLANTQEEAMQKGREMQNKAMATMEQMYTTLRELDAVRKRLRVAKISCISKRDKEALLALMDEGLRHIEGKGILEGEENPFDAPPFEPDTDEDGRARARDAFSQFQVPLKEEEQRDIRKVFVKLSSNFHPDKAKTEQEASHFHSMMQRINEAYNSGDVHTLLEMEKMYLAQGLDLSAAQSFTVDVLDNEIARLKRDLVFINSQVDRTSTEIKMLRESELGNMLTSTRQMERQGVDTDSLFAAEAGMVQVATALSDLGKEVLESKKKIQGFEEEMYRRIMGSAAEHVAGMPDFDIFTPDDDDDDEDWYIDAGYDPILDEMPGFVRYNARPKFPIDSYVLVTGNAESDRGYECSIRGWGGKVQAAYIDDTQERRYLLRLDAQTLRHTMPNAYLQEMFYDIEDPSMLTVAERHLSKTKGRYDEQAAYAAFREREAKDREFNLPPEVVSVIREGLLHDTSLPHMYSWVKYLDHRLKGDLMVELKSKGRGRKKTGRFILQGAQVNPNTQMLEGIMSAEGNPGALFVASLLDIKPVQPTHPDAILFTAYHKWTAEYFDF